jgi:cytochrome c oxidase accessory protein FixG
MSANNLQEQAISLETVEQSLYEVRRKIYPRSVSGVFARWRIYLVAFTQLIFYGLPWLQWNDRQAVLLDLVQRKFYIFGLVLWPQDVIYLTLLLILSALSLFLFTTIAGRLFCGYACPQTVYTEIFMWIERKVEGDRFARIRLDGEEWPWSLRKWRLKITKHFLWVAIAFWTGFTFIGFFAPIRDLGTALLTANLGPWQTFWLGFYSFATWGNAGFLREQICKYMCPYARFQSVMVDKDTFVVTYDQVRGNPRGSRGKNVDYKAQGLGDCVDCSICVQVCPTGIDIRDGLQYMCIGCGACIDACDQVMEKLEYPKGLIRYTSERAVQEKLPNKGARHYILRPRVLVYSTILLTLTAIFFISLATRSPMRFDIMRDRGALAREVDGDKIENVYRLQIMNASENPLEVELTASGLPEMKLLGAQNHEIHKLVVAPASNLLVPLKVRVEMDDVKPGKHPLAFVVTGKEQGEHADDTVRRSEEHTNFIVPE